MSHVFLKKKSKNMKVFMQRYFWIQLRVHMVN